MTKRHSAMSGFNLFFLPIFLFKIKSQGRCYRHYKLYSGKNIYLALNGLNITSVLILIEHVQLVII
jgi:hypothetical protein